MNVTKQTVIAALCRVRSPFRHQNRENAVGVYPVYPLCVFGGIAGDMVWRHVGAAGRDYHRRLCDLPYVCDVCLRCDGKFCRIIRKVQKALGAVRIQEILGEMIEPITSDLNPPLAHPGRTSRLIHPSRPEIPAVKTSETIGAGKRGICWESGAKARWQG